MKHKYLFLILSALMISFCGHAQRIQKRVNKIIREIEQEQHLDKRVVVFEPSIHKEKSGWILDGNISDPELAQVLRNKIDSSKCDLKDQLTLLPDTTTGTPAFGVVTLSVINIRNNGTYSAELVSQALLGTPVRILEHKGWWRIQTPDNYIGYVTSGVIQPMNGAEFKQWENSEKIIYTAIYGNSYTNPDIQSQPISDLVSGGVLQKTGEKGDFYEIRFPDGRVGFVLKSEALPYEQWKQNCNPTPENIIASAFRLLGIPYLWGGTSVKGMDCSGFIKTIAWMNGVTLQRDASQQAYQNEAIMPGKDYENLKAGDLLFFGRPKTDTEKERVIHVGLYLGNKRFIHAGSRIRTNSFDPASPEYDEYNKNRFLWATRPFTSQ